ncbi:holdfast anchor protein HfaD [Hyphobacterium sp.]|uniref:holdfast anchor protein HfaD n=1 Tax=Hyphobacterium sp. TaxID=2004662 RepID=UPI003BAD8F12
MSRFARALTAGTSAATLLCATGYADDTTEILNGQINLQAQVNAQGQVVAGQTGNINLTAGGVGNALDVETQSSHDVTSDQQFGGFATATASTSVSAADGTATTISSAYGNSAVLELRGDSDIDMTQSASDGSNVFAGSTLNVGSYAYSNITAATAAANAVETIGSYGSVAGTIRQDSGAAVEARSIVEARTAGLGEFSVTAATASGNAIRSQGDESAVILATDQANRGAVRASARVNAGGGGVFTTVAAQAQGNGLDIATEWAYGEARGSQVNSGNTDAEANINIGNFDNESILASSESLGNSAILTNLGTDTFLGLDQINTGGVRSVTRFDGDFGGEVLGSAAAFGNAATSWGCQACPDTQTEGVINQTNSGTVDATFQTQYLTGWGTTGTATAIGNSATFVIQDGP